MAMLLYIDPGGGSYLVQAIIAAVLGFMFYFKTLWFRVRSFFVRPKTKPPTENDKERS